MFTNVYERLTDRERERGRIKGRGLVGREYWEEWRKGKLWSGCII